MIKLRYGKPGRDLIIRDAPQGVKFALGENVTRSRGPVPQHPDGRRVRDRAGLRGRPRPTGPSGTRTRKPQKTKDPATAGPPPRIDLRLEALAGILDGSIKIHSHCYRSDEILMLLRTAERYGVRVQSLQHVLEGYKVAAEIAAHGASASTFSDWWAYKIEAYDAIPYNAALLTEAGASVCIKSDDDELMRHLNLEAAKMVKYGGVSEAQALAMITINPARELGLDDRLGSIEVGKDADIVALQRPSVRRLLAVRAGPDRWRGLFPAARARRQVRCPARATTPRCPAAAEARPQPDVIEIAAAAEGIFRAGRRNLHPVTGPEIKGDTLVVAGGKIAAIGPAGTPIPPRGPDDRACAVWTSGRAWSTPARRSACSRSAACPRPRTSPTPPSSSPSFEPARHFIPTSEHIPVTRANGILTSLRPAGRRADLRARLRDQPGGWVPSELVIADPAALNVTIPTSSLVHPEGPRRGRPGPDRGHEGMHRTRRPGGRSSSSAQGAFRKASRYGDRGGCRARAKGVATPPLDPRLAALVPYAKGQKPVIFHAENRTEILDALELAKELKLKAVIAGAGEGWKVAWALKEAGVPVLVGGTLNPPAHDHDPYDAAYANPARLHAAGVSVAIRSKSGGPFRGNRRPQPPLRGSHRRGLRPARRCGAQVRNDHPGADSGRRRSGRLARTRQTRQPRRDGGPRPSAHNPRAGPVHRWQASGPESRHTQLYYRYLRRLQEVRDGTAPLGIECPGVSPTRLPSRAAAAPSPSSH